MTKKHMGYALLALAAVTLYSASIDQTSSNFDGNTFPGNFEAKLASFADSMSWLPYAVGGVGLYFIWKG